MTIRKLEQSDETAMTELWNSIDEECRFLMYEPGERPESPMYFMGVMKHFCENGSLFLVCEDEGALCAFLTADRGSCNRIMHTAYITIAVKKEYRRMGIGGALLRSLDRWAAEAGILRLELTVMAHNAEALTLYLKSGFEVEGMKKRSMLVDGEYVDEFYMGKLL